MISGETVMVLDDGLPAHALCGCLDGERCEQQERLGLLERRMQATHETAAAAIAGSEQEVERRDKQWREIVATVTAGNVALEAESDHLREELAEWQAAHASIVELRTLVESHMDMARGEWQCVAEIRREKQWATRVINRQNAEIQRLRTVIAELQQDVEHLQQQRTELVLTITRLRGVIDGMGAA